MSEMKQPAVIVNEAAKLSVTGEFGGYVIKEDGSRIGLVDYVRDSMSVEEFNKLKLSDDGKSIKNMITAGYHYTLAEMFVTGGITTPIYMAVGSSTLATSRNDTKLNTEIKRVLTTREYDPNYALSTPDPSDPTVYNCINITGTFDGPTDEFDIGEVGLFWGSNASTAADTGKLMSKRSFPKVIPKYKNISIILIWRYTFRFID